MSCKEGGAEPLGPPPVKLLKAEQEQGELLLYLMPPCGGVVACWRPVEKVSGRQVEVEGPDL